MFLINVNLNQFVLARSIGFGYVQLINHNLNLARIDSYTGIDYNAMSSQHGVISKYWIKSTVLSLLSTQGTYVSHFRWALIEMLKNSAKDRYLL